jgi:hypothetical protein
MNNAFECSLTALQCEKYICRLHYGSLCLPQFLYLKSLYSRSNGQGNHIIAVYPNKDEKFNEAMESKCCGT